MRLERVFTTLIRDPTSGLGFSISGGKGADPWIEGSDAVYISKVAEGGPAAKDGKLLVGDKLVQINGVDVAEADHRDVRVSRGFVKGLPPPPIFGTTNSNALFYGVLLASVLVWNFRRQCTRQVEGP